jgi:ribonuclease E
VPVDAASFLLNEKRAEIQKLEARLKVNIILVPNPHLETPHYKVQRLKHDELNAMEHVPASYEMVEQPEEPKSPETVAAEKRERPEAVVKAIVPDQPAPVVPEVQLQPSVRREAARPVPTATDAVAASGFLGRILGWFKSDKPDAASATDATVHPVREPRRERRPDPRHGGGEKRDGGRDHRRDRPRDEHRPRQGGERRPQQGGERRPQQGGERRPEQRHGGQPQRDHRQGGERRPDQQRPQQQQQRPPRPEQPQQQGPRNGEAVAAGEREGEEQRRGRRGRRDRHRGEHRPEQLGEQRPPQGLPVAEHDADVSVPNANELRAREREMHLAQMREEARQREETAVRDEPRQAPVRQEPVYAEPAPAPVQAPVRVDPKVILESAGLQMVETNPAKARQPLPEPESVQLGRPRRDKPVEQQPASEELMQIETRK